MSKKKKSDAKRPAFHEEFAAKIIEHLEAGTAPWQKPWHPGKTPSAPNNPQSGTIYKGVNRLSLSLTMMIKGYDDPRWMTYKQANDMGLRVKQGSKSEVVIFYQFVKEQDRLDDDGKPVLDADGKPEKESIHLDRPIMRAAWVFNAAQIEGMPPMELTDKAFEWDPVEKAENILSVSGANIKHDQSNRAFYRYSEDTIHLPPRENFEDPAKYYGTALHELGHWTRHETRLNRENGPFGSELYAREELRAEIASWMLGEDIGIPHEPGQHAAYVKSWIEALKKDPYEIVRACRDAEQIKGYVMGLEQRKELAQEKMVAQPAKAPEREQGIAAMELPASPAKEKTFIDVPYAEKDEAKALGAKWDRAEKSWFIPPGVNQAPFEKWQDPRQVEFDRVYGTDCAGLVAETQNRERPLYDKSTFELKLLSNRLETELAAAREEATEISATYSTDSVHWEKAKKNVVEISSGYERTLRALLFKQEQERNRYEEKAREQKDGIPERSVPPVYTEEIAAMDRPELKKFNKELTEKWEGEIRMSDARIRELEKELKAATSPVQKANLQDEISSEQKMIGRFRGELERLERVQSEKTQDLPKRTLPPQEEFARVLESAGLDLRGGLPIMDGQIHRVPLVDGKPGALDASYCGHADGVPNGWADNFKTGERVKWTGNGHTLTDEQKTQMREESMRRKEERMREVSEKHDRVAEQSRGFYDARQPAHSDHAYLMNKGIPSDPFRVSPTGKELVVPLINSDGEIRSLQFIGEDGTKRFMPGGEKKGCFFLMGADIKDEKNLASGEILLAEGVATGASLQVSTGKPVAVAFDAGNLEAVAVKLRERFPNAAITICADNDHKVTRNDTLYNVGVEKAKSAAQRVGGTVKVPEFSKEEKAKGLTDFNDLHKARGIDAVRRQVDGKSLARDSGMSR